MEILRELFKDQYHDMLSTQGRGSSIWQLKKERKSWVMSHSERFIMHRVCATLLSRENEEITQALAASVRSTHAAECNELELVAAKWFRVESMALGRHRTRQILGLPPAKPGSKQVHNNVLSSRSKRDKNSIGSSGNTPSDRKKTKSRLSKKEQEKQDADEAASKAETNASVQIGKCILPVLLNVRNLPIANFPLLTVAYVVCWQCL